MSTKPRVYVKVPLSPYSGYGNDGIGIVTALIEAGADVFVEPSVVQFPLPEIVHDHINKTIEGPFDLSIVHLDPMAMEATDNLRASSGIVIGWTMWEYSELSNVPSMFWGDRKEIPDLEEFFREKLRNFDAILAYDVVTKEAFEPYFDGPIMVVQGGFDPRPWPESAARDWNSPEFRFCQHGVLSDRKNPMASVQAFGMAKSLDPEFNRWARLSLHTTTPGLHSKMESMFGTVEKDGKLYEEAPDGTLYQSLRIFYDLWPTETVRSFYDANHVLLAPSRGEGKNVPALEFMSTGGTVIATAWGGHTGWLNEDYSYALDFTLRPSEPGSTALNADAAVQHLCELMLRCFNNRDEVRRKGEAAAASIPLMMSWDRVMDRMLFRINDELGSTHSESFTNLAELDFIRGSK